VRCVGFNYDTVTGLVISTHRTPAGGLRVTLRVVVVACSPFGQPSLPTDDPIDLRLCLSRLGPEMITNQSVTFFDTQFQKQVANNDFALNPFEKTALPYMHGRVLDLGCGMGNLSIEAARHGAKVLAVDASSTAIERIQKTAAAENLAIDTVLADIGNYEIAGQFDTVVAIGLLMFFKREKALALLAGIQRHVAGQGLAIVNVLTEGTTFMGMFEPGNYYLFGQSELEDRFKGWKILHSAHDGFDAPENTRKEFSTVVAQRLK
jgi:tellurite methyltransferase